MRYAVALAFLVVPSIAPAQQPARWTVDPTPTLTLGANEADTNDIFTQVVGATRLPDGRVLVGDYGRYALRMYSADGKLARRFGRKGGGPGEIGYLAALLRCGDSIVTIDIDGHRTSVFSLGGEFRRVFRFSSPQTGRPPYQTTCNSRGTFAHYGWETMADVKGGAYRPMVPLWVSKADSGQVTVVASIAGSERVGLVIDGKPRGTRPLPLGRQTAIAMGSERVYVATGDRYEVAVYDLSGKPLQPLRETRTPRALVRADIDYELARTVAMAASLERRAAIEQDFETLPFPKSMPAYSALRIDQSGLVWAQNSPEAASPSTWTVYDTNGRRVATAALPSHFEVYEIGPDYVLGRFLDPEESIPQVRMYRLRRGG